MNYMTSCIYSAKPFCAGLSLQELDCCEFWGILGDRTTWRAVPISLFESLWGELLHEGPSCDVANHPPELPTMASAALEEAAAAARLAGEAEDQPGASLSTAEPVLAPVLLNNAVPSRSKLRTADKALQGAAGRVGRAAGAVRPPAQAVAVPLIAASAISRRPRR